MDLDSLLVYDSRTREKSVDKTYSFYVIAEDTSADDDDESDDPDWCYSHWLMDTHDVY